MFDIDLAVFHGWSEGLQIPYFMESFTYSIYKNAGLGAGHTIAHKTDMLPALIELKV